MQTPKTIAHSHTHTNTHTHTGVKFSMWNPNQNNNKLLGRCWWVMWPQPLEPIVYRERREGVGRWWVWSFGAKLLPCSYQELYDGGGGECMLRKTGDGLNNISQWGLRGQLHQLSSEFQRHSGCEHSNTPTHYINPKAKSAADDYLVPHKLFWAMTRDHLKIGRAVKNKPLPLGGCVCVCAYVCVCVYVCTI